eukprot:gene24482-biopygen10056
MQGGNEETQDHSNNHCTDIVAGGIITHGELDRHRREPSIPPEGVRDRNRAGIEAADHQENKREGTSQ